jgi:hypothetical protein
MSSRPLLHRSEMLSLQPQTDHRSQTRSNVFLAASLVAAGASLPVRVRNLSAHGALLDGNALPLTGASVRLLRGELSAEGQVAWAAQGHAGIRFARHIDVAQWVKRLGHPGQQRVDEAIAAMRREPMLQEPAVEAPPPSLGEISEQLDGICERLAGSGGMTLELSEELARLDALARAMQRIAAESR